MSKKRGKKPDMETWRGLRHKFNFKNMSEGRTRFETVTAWSEGVINDRRFREVTLEAVRDAVARKTGEPDLTDAALREMREAVNRYVLRLLAVKSAVVLDEVRRQLDEHFTYAVRLERLLSAKEGRLRLILELIEQASYDRASCDQASYREVIDQSSYDPESDLDPLSPMPLRNIAELVAAARERLKPAEQTTDLPPWQRFVADIARPARECGYRLASSKRTPRGADPLLSPFPSLVRCLNELVPEDLREHARVDDDTFRRCVRDALTAAGVVPRS